MMINIITIGGGWKMMINIITIIRGWKGSESYDRNYKLKS